MRVLASYTATLGNAEFPHKMPHSSSSSSSSVRGGAGTSSPQPGVLLNLPYHITVEKKRKALDVLSWGSFPFAMDEHGNLIPNGFSVRTYYKGKWFVARTRVASPEPPASPSLAAQPAVPPAQQEQYQFVCETSEPHCVGDWNPTPSGALQSVVDKLGSSIKCARGSNGALQIGVTYYNVQLAIRKVFCLQSAQAAAAAVARETATATENSGGCTGCEEAGDSLAAVQHDVALPVAAATSTLATTAATTPAVVEEVEATTTTTTAAALRGDSSTSLEEDYQSRKRALVADDLASPSLDWGEAYLLDSGEDDWFPASGF